MNRAIIRIQHLKFAYPRAREPVLRGINLEIPEGELVIVTGANGSGKTTLGKCMNGLIPYSTGGVFEGKVEVCGIHTFEKDVSELALYVGFVFGNPEDQLATPRVETEIAFGLCNLAVPRETILEKTEAIFHRLGIERLKGRSTFELSTGEQQMVAIASILVMEPTILILDDPLSHLNQNTCQKVIDVVRGLNRAGTTIIWISQNISEMFEFADRIVLLDNGEIGFNGPPRAMAEEMDFKGLPVIVPQHIELSQELVKAGFSREIIEPSLRGSIQKLNELTETMEPVNLSTPRPEARGSLEVHPEPRSFIPPSKAELRAVERVNDTGKAISSKPDSTREPMIQFDHVTFSYPDGFTALKDISLEFHEGDFVLVSGWNGSGKTTLAKHLNGLLRPTEGRMVIGGQDISDRPTSDLARGIGFLFQNPDHQLHRPTVRDELAFSLINFGVDTRTVTEKISTCAESFQLKHLLDRSPQELSGSEKKRVTVASVLIYDPAIVIFDEPTANLDQIQAKNIIDIIERYFDDTKVVLCISHDIRLWVESRRLNRVVIMKDGRVFKQGDPENIFCDPTIMEFLYGSVLPITQIAQSLSGKGVRPRHYRASTLAEEITRPRKRSHHAAGQ